MEIAEEFIRIFEEERARLGLQNLEVVLENQQPTPAKRIDLVPFSIKNLFKVVSLIFEGDYSLSVVKVDERKYAVRVPVGYRLEPVSFRGSARHELFHIADGHCERPYNPLRYYLYQERRAIAYEKGLIRNPRPKVH
mgnify:FL=1